MIVIRVSDVYIRWKGLLSIFAVLRRIGLWIQEQAGLAPQWLDRDRRFLRGLVSAAEPSLKLSVFQQVCDLTLPRDLTSVL